MGTSGAASPATRGALPSNTQLPGADTDGFLRNVWRHSRRRPEQGASMAFVDPIFKQPITSARSADLSQEVQKDLTRPGQGWGQ